MIVLLVTDLQEGTAEMMYLAHGVSQAENFKLIWYRTVLSKIPSSVDNRRKMRKHTKIRSNTDFVQDEIQAEAKVQCISHGRKRSQT